MQLSLRRKEQTCKRCGMGTGRVHDYRVRQVRDLELQGKPLRLLYRQRRYICPKCGKRFSEANDFVGWYMHFTHRTGEKIMSLLRRRSSMKDIARDTGNSVKRRATRTQADAGIEAPAPAGGHLLRRVQGKNRRSAFPMHRHGSPEPQRFRYPSCQDGGHDPGLSALLPQSGRSEVRGHGHKPQLPRCREGIPAQREDCHSPCQILALYSINARNKMEKDVNSWPKPCANWWSHCHRTPAIFRAI